MPSAALLISGDLALAHEVRRLAAQAGVELRELPPDVPLPALSRGDLLAVGADLPESSHEEARLLAARAGADAVRLAFGAPLGGADSHAFALPRDAERLVLRLEATSPRRDSALRVGVAASAGGIGTSVLAAALARTAPTRRGRALIDLDLAGGGLDQLLGITHTDGPRWPAVAAGHGAEARSLPAWHGVAVLSAQAGAPLDAGAPLVRDALETVSRSCDIVVLDLARAPRGLDVTRAAGWCDRVVLLVPLLPQAVGSALSALDRLCDLAEPVVVGRKVHRSGLTRSELAEAIGLPVRHAMASERGLAADLAHGGSPADRRGRAVARAARSIWRDLLPGGGS